MSHRTIAKILIIPIALSLLAGCVFTREKFVPVRFYDLGNPQAEKSPACLKVGVFTVTGPYKQEMVYRTEKNELQRDQYNKWALTPDVLLKRQLKMSFSGEARKGPCYTISGSILAFEADLARQEAFFMVEYRLTAQTDLDTAVLEKTASFRIKLEDTSPEGFAAAMSKSVSEFTKGLASELSKLSTK